MILSLHIQYCNIYHLWKILWHPNCIIAYVSTNRSTVSKWWYSCRISLAKKYEAFSSLLNLSTFISTKIGCILQDRFVALRSYIGTELISSLRFRFDSISDITSLDLEKTLWLKKKQSWSSNKRNFISEQFLVLTKPHHVQSINQLSKLAHSYGLGEWLLYLRPVKCLGGSMSHILYIYQNCLYGSPLCILLIQYITSLLQMFCCGNSHKLRLPLTNYIYKLWKNLTAKHLFVKICIEVLFFCLT